MHEAQQINEGEGDFLLVGDVILAGTGFRTSVESHAELAEVTGREVVTLRLVDPRFYHLDTALAVLDPAGADANIAFLPLAFDDASRAELAPPLPRRDRGRHRRMRAGSASTPSPTAATS